jgi:hypothetical protein
MQCSKILSSKTQSVLTPITYHQTMNYNKRRIDEKFLGLLYGHIDFCHGIENRLFFCHIMIHRKVFWRKLQCDDMFVFKSVKV